MKVCILFTEHSDTVIPHLLFLRIFVAVIQDEPFQGFQVQECFLCHPQERGKITTGFEMSESVFFLDCSSWEQVTFETDDQPGDHFMKLFVYR